MKWLGWTVLGIVTAGSIAVFGSCSAQDDTALPTTKPATGGAGHGGSASGGSGTDSSTLFETGTGGSTATCTPACQAPQFCSVKGSCIDQNTCLADQDCSGTGMKCDTLTSTCVPGSDCGAEELAAEPVPPNMLIVLDRSCSMTNDNQLVDGKTKWSLAVAALNTVIKNAKDKLRFGLILFPDLVTPNCEESDIPVPVSDQGAEAITALLDKSMATKKVTDWYPGNPCVTPIDTALALAGTEPAFKDKTRQSYVLLVTDGKQTACETNVEAREAAGIATLSALHLQQDISTFVLGFGGEIDPTYLTQCAEAGGVPKAGATKFYDAQNAASLDQALAAITAKAALSCTLELKSTPPDATKIYVFFNKKDEATRDTSHSNGWDYDSATNRIVFYGQACDDLKNGVVTAVDVVFGCKQAPVN